MMTINYCIKIEPDPKCYSVEAAVLVGLCLHRWQLHQNWGDYWLWKFKYRYSYAEIKNSYAMINSFKISRITNHLQTWWKISSDRASAEEPGVMYGQTDHWVSDTGTATHQTLGCPTAPKKSQLNYVGHFTNDLFLQVAGIKSAISLKEKVCKIMNKTYGRCFRSLFSYIYVLCVKAQSICENISDLQWLSFLFVCRLIYPSCFSPRDSSYLDSQTVELFR